MQIEVLVCRPDGSQAMEAREVSDNYFAQEVTADEQYEQDGQASA